METDARATHKLVNYNKAETAKEKLIRKAENIVVDMIGAPTAKRIIDKLK